MKQILSIFITCWLLVSCASDNGVNLTLSEDEIYQKATETFDNESYHKAVLYFKKLEEEYPFSKYMRDSFLKKAYAHYHIEEYIEAEQTASEFLNIYPASEYADQAVYLMALCSYNQITDPQRDQSFALNARKHLTHLIDRFPHSEYLADSQLKLDYVNDHLAAKNMEIGRFYLKDQNIPAAINRFKAVVQKYETTSHIQEALYRMIEGYLILGLMKPAYDTALLLGHNYPDNVWYHRAYDLVQNAQKELSS